MPNYFELRAKATRIEDRQHVGGEVVTFQSLDQELCTALKVECDPKKYYGGWVDYIGFGLANGKSFDEIIDFCFMDIEEWEESTVHESAKKLIVIATWMKQRVIASAWYQPKY